MTDPSVVRVPGTARVIARGRILFVVLLSLSMSLMAVSAVNVALPTIQVGLGASPSDLQWVLAGYGLAFGIGLIPAGRAGDVLGRSSLFMVGLVVFVGGSLACGLAATPLGLNLARLLQGIGAGVFSPQVTGVIQQYFSGAARARAFGLFGLVISASVAVGPVLAGAIIQVVGPASGWRWAFWSNLPLGLLALALATRWLPFDTERQRRIDGGRPTGRIDLDPVGSLLVALLVLAVMLPFVAHENPWWWAVLALAPVFAAAWIRWERGYAARGRQPMVDLTLFGFRSFRNGIAVSATLFLAAPATVVVIMLFLQSGLGASALEAGLVALPNALVSAWASVWAGRRAMEQGRRIILVALWAQLIGVALGVVVAFGIATRGWSLWWLAATFALNGFGMGAATTANQTLTMHDVPARHGGSAGGLKQTLERIGTALGNAAVTGVFFGLRPGAGWVGAFAGAYGTIAAILLGALGLAVLDERQHRS